jgi:hypothetical protein
MGGNNIWGEWFAGRIDEVRVYNRALTAAQVQTDMTQPVTSAAFAARSVRALRHAARHRAAIRLRKQMARRLRR